MVPFKNLNRAQTILKSGQGRWERVGFKTERDGDIHRLAGPSEKHFLVGPIR